MKAYNAARDPDDPKGRVIKNVAVVVKSYRALGGPLDEAEDAIDDCL